MRGKGPQIYVEICAQIDDKSMRFRNLRFLDFCEEYNVKLLFLHVQGERKSSKHLLKICGKSSLGKNTQNNEQIC